MALIARFLTIGLFVESVTFFEMGHGLGNTYRKYLQSHTAHDQNLSDMKQLNHLRWHALRQIGTIVKPIWNASDTLLRAPDTHLGMLGVDVQEHSAIRAP